MQNFISKTLSEAAEQAGNLGRHFVMLMSAMMLVLVFAVVALGFLTAAAFLWLSAEYGQMEALLAIGGVFIVLAGLAAIAATGMKPADAAAKAAAKARIAANPAATVAPPPKAPTPAAVETLLKVLDDGGHQNERLAVLATSEAIRNAKPIQLVVIGLVAGFAGGQLIKQTVKKRPLV